MKNMCALHWKITLIIETSEYLFLFKGTLGVPLDCMHVMPCVTMYCSLHVQMCVCTSQLRIKKSEGQAAKTFFLFFHLLLLLLQKKRQFDSQQRLEFSMWREIRVIFQCNAHTFLIRKSPIWQDIYCGQHSGALELSLAQTLI